VKSKHILVKLLMPITPVFIVGSPRSGTSMLVDAMYCLGYRGFREGMFFPLLFTVDHTINQHFNMFASNGNKEILISNLDRDQIKNEVFSTIKKFGDMLNPEEPWFDKTGNPEMILAIPILLKLWPESVFVFAKRRAIENIVSRLKKFPNFSFEYHCANWAKNMSSWRNVTPNFPPSHFIEIDQQDMLQEPEMVAASLCDFVRGDVALWPKAAKLLRSSRPQQTQEGSAARVYTLDSTGWSDQQKNIFQSLCGAEMKYFGYTNDENYRERAAFAMTSANADRKTA
jgi:hypothetical protein